METVEKDKLLRQRDIITRRISRIHGFIQQCLADISSTKRQHVEIRQKHLNECWIELNDVQNKIEIADEDCDLEKETIQRAQNEDIQFDLESQIGDLLDRLPPITRNSQALTHTNSGTSTTRVKLPIIEIPKFSGNYQEWTSYYDLFISLIHNNIELTPVQKLFYLKGSLEGEARKLLNSFSSTNANYEEAWKVLINRYQNQRVIINSHISTLFNMKQLQGDVSTALRKLLDTTVENIRALNVLGEATDYWNSILIHLVTSKLDAETCQHWELSLKDETMPKFTQLQEFLEQRCRALEAATSYKSTKPSPRITPAFRQATIHHAVTNSCEICKLNHLPFQCDILRKANINERANIVKAKALCFNCLRAGHQTQSCRSTSCKKCNKRHHTLLHREPELALAPKVTDSTEDVQLSAHFSEKCKVETQVLLSTALILVKDSLGEYHKCRALLDSGSQASLITESCIQRLRLPRRNTTTSIKAVGHLPSPIPCGTVTCSFTGINSNHSHVIDALVLKKITGLLPQRSINTVSWTHLEGIQLADPTFCQPGAVDILLGANIYTDLMLSGKRVGQPGTPTALQTTLGWVLSGIAALTTPAQELISHHVTIDIGTELRKFWEVEELPTTRVISTAEQFCEDHFRTTHSRDNSGRFTVRLPFDPNITQLLGDNRPKAISRLKHTEANLARQQELYIAYQSFMTEYADLGHMSRVTKSVHSAPDLPYYIPHHAVQKDSTTTKLRVVFDASCKTTTGISLNDKLLVGPAVQESLMAIVMRFRIYPFVFTADIAKMFRQILVHKDDRQYQRILWRNSFNEPIVEYELNTVTYGTACGTYLATKTLQQLAADGKEQFPLGSHVVSTDFYIDDLMSGAMTIEEAIAVQREVIALLAGGGFELRKWTANNQQMLSHLPAELCATEESLALAFGTAVKTLGLQWHPQQDHFTFSIKQSESLTTTKRTILSATARLFDPLGWLSPAIIRPKLLMQKLWLLGAGWDDPLPPNIIEEWKGLQHDFLAIQEVKLQRHIGIHSWSDRYELHGFCDSSEAAYAAVAYIRTISPDGSITTAVLCSKTRVALLKQLSLPRLELCGAYLLARLLTMIVKETKLNFARIMAWTDSTIVLAWLSAPPRKWTTFVANRVALIQDMVAPEDWGHVKSENNPADCASRGLTVQELIGFSLWWTGPHWLCQNSSEWKPRSKNDTDTALELRTVKVVGTMFKLGALPIENKYSTFSKLVWVTALCLRFVNNCRVNRSHRITGLVSTSELTKAKDYWIKTIQQQYFQTEISRLKAQRPLLPSSHLLALSPFLDQAGLLRVGGRIDMSTLSYGKKHPILLPHKCDLTLLIVRSEHCRYLHAGPQLLLSILRHTYWIIGGRNLVRAVVKKCVICHRRQAQTTHQLMGNLPTYRVQPSRPFEHVGIDFGGPFYVKVSKLRGPSAQRTYKAYIALLICMATKAIHLELVTSLSTEALMATLHRFMSRRGKPSNIYSDCGTNFKGANAELQRFSKIASSDGTFQGHLVNESIKWHFIPPGSPHFGGLWEAGIRSTKGHLLKIIGAANLTFEELYTLLTQVEACLNSRPLCPLSSDPCDLEALTPGHFLIGQALTKPPEPDHTHTPMNRLTNWHQVQALHQLFWKRWSTEYLSRLQQRPKWTVLQPNLKVGQLVLLKEGSLPPLKWTLARISEVHPGNDGLVRVVTLRTASGYLKRAVTKISPLPFEN